MLLHLTALLALSTQPPAAAPSPQAPDVPAALGQRIAAARAQTVTASTLVIVPDEPSYLAAIALWHTPSPDHNGARTLFPILIDDGSLPCHEDIARFARAFKPANTLRFTAKGEAPPPPPPRPPPPPPSPKRSPPPGAPPMKPPTSPLSPAVRGHPAHSAQSSPTPPTRPAPPRSPLPPPTDRSSSSLRRPHRRAAPSLSLRPMRSPAPSPRS